MTRTNRPDVPPIPGSWDAILSEAHRLSEQGDKRAVERYRSICDKLFRFGKERRTARSGELQDILIEAHFACIAFLYTHERFDEAANLYEDQIEDELDGVDLDKWQVYQNRALWMAGREDEAIDLLRSALAESPENLFLAWELFRIHFYQDDLGAASDVVATWLHPSTDPDEFSDDETALWAYHTLSMLLAIAREEWSAAIDHMGIANSLDLMAYAVRTSLYLSLFEARELERLAKVVKSETSTVTKSLWLGLIYDERDDEKRARAAWSLATQVDLTTILAVEAQDWALAHFYLGDEERLGLELMLRLLRELNQESVDVDHMAMAALGWAIRGPSDKVSSNLAFAELIGRRRFGSGKIGWQSGLHFKRLLSEEEFAPLSSSFDRSDTGILWNNLLEEDSWEWDA